LHVGNETNKNYIFLLQIVQLQCSFDNSGGKVIILGGDIVGHYGKKNPYGHVSNLNGYQDRGVLIYRYKDIVNGNK